MKKITFLKTFIQTRWLHNFKSREALENYQKKQLANYMNFLKRESPYFKNGVPSDFDHMDKAFMMSYFNELNTQVRRRCGRRGGEARQQRGLADRRRDSGPYFEPSYG